MTSPVDPHNPVVQLCALGMQAEAEGREEDARAIFEQAWQHSTSDYEACIAAHYLARHQPDAHATLRWNREALERADGAADERTRAFYPSLHLNAGHSYEVLGDSAQACRHYLLAEQRLADLPPSGYADMIRRGVAAGQARMRGRTGGTPT